MWQQQSKSGLGRTPSTLPRPPGTVSMAVGLLLLLLALGCLVKNGDAYNVDTEGALIHRGRSGSMFGFSVAQHIDQSTNWLLVGAPMAQTSQRGIDRGGSVFRCSTEREDACQEIPFDRNGNNKARRGDEFVDIEDKSNQWFGATVRSSGENGVIVACAPRYVYFSRTFDKREPVGTCWVANGKTTEFVEISPCRTGVDLHVGRDLFYKTGFCQAGYSADFTKDGSRLLITAVGSWYWQGQLYNYRLDDRSQYAYTREGPPTLDDSYMGYSSAVGEFDGDNVDDYIVGIPKGDQHRGLVAMFTQDFKSLSNISGDQIGAYFGYSVAVTDLGADGLDDVIVGAPLYASYGSSNDYETGRVYIYYQNPKHEFRPSKKDLLDGVQSQSRFGMAVSGLGDINYDGYNDLGVGAPYAGEDRRGAVFIYHGSKLGIITEVSQIIYASDVGTGLSTFGYSLAGGWDQDGNSYPDMVVGAYETDSAVFLRTRPVVRVTASLKIEPKSIDLNITSCSLIDDTKVPCMTVYTCLEYTGIGVPEELFFDVKWELDTLQRNKSKEQRAFFLVPDSRVAENNTIKLTRKATWCTPSFAYVKNDTRDKLTPIAVDFSFELNDRKTRRRRDLLPILDQYVPKRVRTEAHIAKECGPDNECEPNLSVRSFRVSAAHIVGSRSELELLVLVENNREGAYNAELYIYPPPKVSYRYIHGINAPPGIRVECAPEEMDGGEKYVLCVLGNPLPGGAKVNFTLRVDPQKTDGTLDNLIFTMEVNSSNIEAFADTLDNHASVSIPVTAAADLFLSGKSDPEQIHLNTTEVRLHKLLEEKGRDIEHLYELRNLGPSSVETAEFNVQFPSHDAGGNLLLQVDQYPEVTKGRADCHKIVIRPENRTQHVLTYRPGNQQDISVQLQEDRDLRPLGDRAKDIDAIQCSEEWCTIWRCIVGNMGTEDNVLINFKAKLFLGPIVRREGFSKHLIVTRGFARILTMPYNLTSLDVSLLAPAEHRVVTVINPDRLPALSRPIEIWMIAVSVAAGFLVLLLIIVLLWWCGFFKRKKPEDEGYMIANGNPKMDIDNKEWD